MSENIEQKRKRERERYHINKRKKEQIGEYFLKYSGMKINEIDFDNLNNLFQSQDKKLIEENNKLKKQLNQTELSLKEKELEITNLKEELNNCNNTIFKEKDENIIGKGKQKNKNKLFKYYYKQIKNNKKNFSIFPLEETIPFCKYLCKKKFNLNNNEEILLSALMLYLKKHRPEKEQNFTSIMKLLRAFDWGNDRIKNPTLKTPADRIFDEIMKHDPESIAFKYYFNFKALYWRKQEYIISNLISKLYVLEENIYESKNEEKFSSKRIEKVEYSPLQVKLLSDLIKEDEFNSVKESKLENSKKDNKIKKSSNVDNSTKNDKIEKFLPSNELDTVIDDDNNNFK